MTHDPKFAERIRAKAIGIGREVLSAINRYLAHQKSNPAIDALKQTTEELLADLKNKDPSFIFAQYVYRLHEYKQTLQELHILPILPKSVMSFLEDKKGEFERTLFAAALFSPLPQRYITSNEKLEDFWQVYFRKLCDALDVNPLDIAKIEGTKEYHRPLEL